MKCLCIWGWALVVGLVVADGRAQSEYRFLETFSPDEAELTVDVRRRAETPVSPYLFGKFSEHLGSNIYGGLWAEIITNPGMDRFEQIVLKPKPWRRELESRGRTEILDAIEKKLPYQWEACGDTSAIFSFSTKDVVSKPNAAVCTLAGKTEQLTGFSQRFSLPVQRCQEYELTLHYRAEGRQVPDVIRIRLVHDKSGETVFDQRLSNPRTRWQRFNYAFTVNSEGQDWESPQPFRLIIGADTRGSFAVDSLSLMPADNLKGWDCEAIRLIRESGCSMMRFPGGNFVSGYHWEDGVGPALERPTLPNPAWDGQFEPNRVGSAEWIDFFKLTGCEPLLCVNAGDGTPEEARKWVEYFNGAPGTPMGRRRIEDGHPEPLNVRCVEIGNELYGRWQVGYCNEKEYARRYKAFHAKLVRDFPDLVYIANGGPKYEPSWNRTLLEANGNLVRGVSVHYLFDMALAARVAPEAFYWLAMGQAATVDREMDGYQKLLRRHSPNGFVAVTELMLFPQDAGRAYPRAKTAAEMLWYSGFMNSCIRQGDAVKIVTYSASMNHGASLQKTESKIYPTPGWLAYTLYATTEGRHPCSFELRTPFFDIPDNFEIPDKFESFELPKRAPLADALALVSADGGKMHLFLANRSLKQEINLKINLRGGHYASATMDCLFANDMLEQNTSRNPDKIRIETKPHPVGENMNLSLPPLSLVRLTLTD